jgi:hypothetical protein
LTDHPFDRLARRLSGTTSRRQALAALGGLAAARLHPAQAATQLQLATCGEEGAVCTHLKSCCEGLVCATSHINPNYGVCIAGEGEHLAVTTQLVVPGDEAVVTTLTAELAETEEDGAAAAEVIEARQTAKDDRRSTRRSRNDTQRSKKRSRKDTKRSRKRSRRTTDTTGTTTGTTTTCTELQATCASAEECCSNTADCLDTSCGDRRGPVCCLSEGKGCVNDCDCCGSDAVCDENFVCCVGDACIPRA